MYNVWHFLFLSILIFFLANKFLKQTYSHLKLLIGGKWSVNALVNCEHDNYFYMILIIFI